MCWLLDGKGGSSLVNCSLTHPGSLLLVAPSANLMFAATVWVCKQQHKWSTQCQTGFSSTSVHRHQVISCCYLHFAFSCFMFYSFPNMLLWELNSSCFMDQRHNEVCLLFCAFFPQLAKWLKVVSDWSAPAADGDRWCGWFCPIGWHRPLWYHTSCLTESLSSTSASHISPYFTPWSFTYADSRWDFGVHQSCLVVFRTFA